MVKQIQSKEKKQEKVNPTDYRWQQIHEFSRKKKEKKNQNLICTSADSLSKAKTEKKKKKKNLT